MRILLALMVLQGIAHAGSLEIGEPDVIGPYDNSIDLAAKQPALARCGGDDGRGTLAFRIDTAGRVRDIHVDGVSARAASCMARVIGAMKLGKPLDGPVDVVVSLVIGAGPPSPEEPFDPSFGRSGFTGGSDAGWGTIGTGRYGTIGHASGTCCDSLAEIPPHQVPPPKPIRIEFGEVALRGDYNRIFVRRFFKRHREAFEACLDAKAGTATVRVVISESGAVATATASGDAADCLARGARAIEFPKPPNGSVEASIPLTIRRS